MPLYGTFDNTGDEGERGVALQSPLSELPESAPTIFSFGDAV